MRRLTSFLLTFLIALPLFAGDPDTINTVPSANSSFLTDLQTFLRGEDADRFGEQFTGFVVSGGTHGTAAGLIGTPTSMVAYPNGGRVTETGSITYPDNDTCWVIASRPTTGNLGTYTRVAGTHYLTDCASGSIPALPAGAVQLMEVTTAGGAITAVTDLRVRSPIAGPTFMLPSYTLSTLPSAAVAGRVARVTNENVRDVRGIYVDQGSQWYNLFGGVINARSFPGVTGNCADDQTTGLTNFINAVQALAGQNIRQTGYLPRGCYRYTSALPDITGRAVRLVGDGRETVLFNATADVNVPALKVTTTAQNVWFEGLTIEGIPGSGHGINLVASHYFTAVDVVVASTGDTKNGWEIDAVVTGRFYNVRGTCNVPGCTLYTTDITGNGGRGTPARALNILDGNNDLLFVGFTTNGGHTDHAVVLNGAATDTRGVVFLNGVFEAAPAAKNQILVTGSLASENVFIGPYISCSLGLGLEINDGHNNLIMGGQSNCGTVLRGNARRNVFLNHGMTALDILVDGDTPTSNAFYSNNITGTVTDNGSHTTFLGNTSGGASNNPANRVAGLRISSGTATGTEITRYLSGSANLDFTALGANSCETLTITVTGAVTGDVVTVGVTDALADVDGGTERTTFFGWVSSNDVVSVRRCNVTGGSTVDPVAANVRVGVWKH